MFLFDFGNSIRRKSGRFSTKDVQTVTCVLRDRENPLWAWPGGNAFRLFATFFTQDTKCFAPFCYLFYIDTDYYYKGIWESSRLISDTLFRFAVDQKGANLNVLEPIN